MAEVLEIQIQDKPGRGSNYNGPPRPPFAGGVPGPALPREAPASSAATGRIQSAVAGGKPPESIVETILDKLGMGKHVELLREIYGYIGKKSPPQKVPTSPLGKEPVNPAMLRESMEHGFSRIASIMRPVADFFADLTEPGQAVPPAQKAATAPVRGPSTPGVHAQRSGAATAPVRPHPVAQAEPRPPAEHRIPMPSIVRDKEPPRPPFGWASSAGKGQGAAGSSIGTKAAGGAEAAAGAGAKAAGGAEAAAGAEAAGGAMAGLAAAAGPIGVALLAADVAASAAPAAFNKVGETVEGFGHQLSAAAGNDYLGMFKRGLQAVHHPLKDIPIVGKVFEAQLQAAIAPVKAFTEVTEAFTKRAHELAGFSPSIALAEQMSSVRSMMDDFKEANDLGPDFARMLDAESSIQHELREIFLPIKKIIVDVLANVLEVISGTIRDIHAGISAMKEVLMVLVELFNDIFGSGHMKDIPDLIKSIPQRIAKAIVDAQKGDTDDEELKRKILGMTRDLLESHWDKGAAADPWAGVNLDPRPNIPVVVNFPGA